MIEENDQKRVVITGGSGMIGAALVTAFKRANWAVTAPTSAQYDLALPGEAERLVTESGQFDLLINNAADQSILNLADSNLLATRLFQINVLSPMAAMVAAKNSGATSCINISSIEAISPRSGHEIYGASKAALESLTRSLAVSLAPMRINGVRLGLIGDSGLAERWPEGVASWQSAVPAKRYAAPNEVADFILAISGKEFNYTTGAIFDFDGGKSASPGW